MKRKFLPFINRAFILAVGITCGAEVLPEVDFDFCDPEIKTSEIQRIFFAKIGAGDFVDWTMAEEWTTRMSETSVDLNAIRPFTVIGDKPQPATTKKPISNNRTFNSRKDHTLNFTVDEVTATNHSFLQAVENGVRLRMWYETSGGLMFGGNKGIAAEISGDMILARGNGEIMVYNFVATWASSRTEDRCVSPIFGETVIGSGELDTTVLFDVTATPAVDGNDWILVGGTNAVARFRYDNINPVFGTAMVMTVKVGGVLKLTANLTRDFEGGQFEFVDIAGVSHTGIMQAGDVLF